MFQCKLISINEFQTNDYCIELLEIFGLTDKLRRIRITNDSNRENPTNNSISMENNV